MCFFLKNKRNIFTKIFENLSSIRLSEKIFFNIFFLLFHSLIFYHYCSFLFCLILLYVIIILYSYYIVLYSIQYCFLFFYSIFLLIFIPFISCLLYILNLSNYIKIIPGFLDSLFYTTIRFYRIISRFCSISLPFPLSLSPPLLSPSILKFNYILSLT